MRVDYFIFVDHRNADRREMKSRELVVSFLKFEKRTVDSDTTLRKIDTDPSQLRRLKTNNSSERFTRSTILLTVSSLPLFSRYDPAMVNILIEELFKCSWFLLHIVAFENHFVVHRFPRPFYYLNS